MTKKPKILAFAGSLREHSYNKRVVKTAIEGAKNAGAEVTFIDLKQYPMPIYDADEHKSSALTKTRWRFKNFWANTTDFLSLRPNITVHCPAV